MWVFLNNAFLSIVDHKTEPGMLMVRARLRGDIQRAFAHPGLKVFETPAADYRFRAVIHRSRVAETLKDAVLDIDYVNFKKSVPDQRRHDAYLRVWAEMQHEQEMALLEEGMVLSKMKPAKYPPRGAMQPLDLPLPDQIKNPFGKALNPLRCEGCLHLKQECMCGKPLTIKQTEKLLGSEKSRPYKGKPGPLNRRGKKASRPRSSRR